MKKAILLKWLLVLLIELSTEASLRGSETTEAISSIEKRDRFAALAMTQLMSSPIREDIHSQNRQ